LAGHLKAVMPLLSLLLLLLLVVVLIGRSFR
jgi:hypothetical protein